MTFNITAQTYFHKTIPQTNPKLLEPMMKIKIITPKKYLNNMIDNLNNQHNQVQNMETHNNTQMMTAMVPLTNIFNYVNTLRSMSQKHAQYTIHFDHYKQVPQTIANKIRTKIA